MKKKCKVKYYCGDCKVQISSKVDDYCKLCIEYCHCIRYPCGNRVDTNENKKSCQLCASHDYCINCDCPVESCGDCDDYSRECSSCYKTYCDICSRLPKSKCGECNLLKCDFYTCENDECLMKIICEKCYESGIKNLSGCN